tara:strand:- start:1653 stop:2420 length:768 start_codon:yes stop_codon:yes gene_type:complete
VYGRCKRICPEAPVPLLELSDTPPLENMGMAANVKRNIEYISDDQVEVHLITNHTSITKTRYVDSKYNEIVIRIDEDDRCSPIELSDIVDDDYDLVVISDYNKGFLGEEVLSKLPALFKCKNFIDTKKILKPWASVFDYVKINDIEFDRTMRCLGEGFVEYCDNVIVTQGDSGANLFHNRKCKAYPTQPVVINDVSGAGDTFLAGLVCEYLRSQSLDKAIKFANKCARVVVQKPNVSFVTAEELEGYNPYGHYME